MTTVMDPIIASDPEINELIRARWSPRTFADREVPRAELRKLFEAARWAASSFNEQPWRFIVATRSDAGYEKLLASLVEGNRQWARQAPVLVLTVGKRTFSHNGAANRYALHDTGMALANLMLQATSMGLAVHAMGGFDHAEAREAFHIPEDYELGAAVAVGYPAESGEPPKRSRKPLPEEVFSDDWGHPAVL